MVIKGNAGQLPKTGIAAKLSKHRFVNTWHQPGERKRGADVFRKNTGSGESVQTVPPWQRKTNGKTSDDKTVRDSTTNPVIIQ